MTARILAANGRERGTEALCLYYRDITLTRATLYAGAAVQARRVRALEAARAARARDDRGGLARPAVVAVPQETGRATP